MHKVLIPIFFNRPLGSAERIYHLPPSRQGKKAVGIFVTPEASKQLRRLALEMYSSVQALGVEALNDLFAKYDQPPIA